MKERAIVIFELEEKEERENRAEVMELTGGRDGEQRSIFKLRQNGSCATHIHLQQKTKGYPTLVSSFNAYKKNARSQVSGVMIQPLSSCHLRAMSPPSTSSRSTVFM
jgi:hypothetical protein